MYGDVDVKDGRCYASSDCEETSERASSHRARPTPVVMEQRQPKRERAGLAAYRMPLGGCFLCRMKKAIAQAGEREWSKYKRKS